VFFSFLHRYVKLLQGLNRVAQLLQCYQLFLLFPLMPDLFELTKRQTEKG
jgi:hypothetical protein